MFFRKRKKNVEIVEKTHESSDGVPSFADPSELASDIEAAQEQGFNTIKFEDAGQLEKELQNLGVKL